MLEVMIEPQRICIGPRFGVSFYRTLRIPDDGRTYPLPPGLGVFPIFKVTDYHDRVPSVWREHGGVFIPLYQREALWLGFTAAAWKPNAVKVAIGNINAVSGEAASEHLHVDPQDYVVCPEQIWLDGINAGTETIRQFVAMPLGQGYTVEAALTGSEQIGGLQITVFEPKPGRFPDEPPSREKHGPVRFAAAKSTRAGGVSMGLGAGGVMRQKIYPDPYGIEAWDQNNWGAVMVHLVNSEHFHTITGVEPPLPPIDAQTYTQYGLPWFDLYDETKGDVPPPERLTSIKTVAQRDAERGTETTEATSIPDPTPQVTKIRRE
ncbi:MAG: hypothetical protein AB7G75_15110 [Candidatus Binatia bacterium]